MTNSISTVQKISQVYNEVGPIEGAKRLFNYPNSKSLLLATVVLLNNSLLNDNLSESDSELVCSILEVLKIQLEHPDSVMDTEDKDKLRQYLITEQLSGTTTNSVQYVDGVLKYSIVYNFSDYFANDSFAVDKFNTFGITIKALTAFANQCKDPNNKKKIQRRISILRKCKEYIEGRNVLFCEAGSPTAEVCGPVKIRTEVRNNVLCLIAE